VPGRSSQLYGILHRNKRGSLLILHSSHGRSHSPLSRSASLTFCSTVPTPASPARRDVSLSKRIMQARGSVYFRDLCDTLSSIYAEARQPAHQVTRRAKLPSHAAAAALISSDAKGHRLYCPLDVRLRHASVPNYCNSGRLKCLGAILGTASDNSRSSRTTLIVVHGTSLHAQRIEREPSL
jgi:hypothetical protein